VAPRRALTALDHDNQNRLSAPSRRIAQRADVPFWRPFVIEIGTAVGIELDAFAPRHSAAAV
jgi:hypothetical protein